MDHMQKLGTMFFKGGTKPIEADEWINRLERNFESIRCREQYRKDIAVHHLEGDAHTWWRGAVGRERVGSWADFHGLFKTKYFPPEAHDRLESAFLDLRQGSKSVREYEAEFNKLKKFAGWGMTDEHTQIKRFIRGLRIDLKKHCEMQDYPTLPELVEKAAQLEETSAEEAKLVGHPAAGPKKGGLSGKPPAGRNAGSAAGKEKHASWRASGACLQCVSMEHKVKDCPEEDKRGKNPGNGSDERVFFHCGEAEHIKPKWPELMQVAQHTGKRPSEGQAPPAKRQAVTPRIYAVAEQTAEDPSSSRPITGTLIMGGVATHVLFDSGATHCFVNPNMVGKSEFCRELGDNYGLVQAAGGQVMFTLGKVKDVSVMVGSRNMPADLEICEVKSYDVILGMDWVGKYKARLDCCRGRIRFETAEGILEYQGIRPTKGSLIVSAMQADRMVEKGCEAYLATITTAEVGPDAELGSIPVVSEFEDVFRVLTGLPPARSDPFTIELEPGTAPIS
ncbi:uncharacterized protein LOC112086596 [Eutrema salsugineum]|uniref:uncharacterized protein LOC112086596 n=1 Tax=Eutrema salsugineum TaxID=72664 RepID=UPI000CED242A|nr:uncharacterized protein LOC112086596 [Eutrema salsugineum]